MKCEALYAYAEVAPKDDTLPDMLVRAMKDTSPEVRGHAAQVAGNLGPLAAATVPELRHLLEDNAERSLQISLDFASLRAVRSDAAEALGRIGPASKASVERLVTMMTNDADAEVRATAALAVFRIEDGSEAAMNALIAGLKDDSDGTGGPEAAAYALSELGPKAGPALDALTESLRHRDEFVRMASLHAIATIGGTEAVRILASALDDDHWQVQKTAVEELGELGTAGAVSVPRLTELARDKATDVLVRDAAIEALGDMGPAARSALPTLQQIAKSEPDSSAGEAAVEAIERISQPE